ncbi:hypothetical protein ACOZ0K_005047, partial [Escherichia coli]
DLPIDIELSPFIFLLSALSPMAIFVPSPSVTTAMPSSAEKAGMDTAAYKKINFDISLESFIFLTVNHMY